MLLNWEEPLNLNPRISWKSKKWQIKTVSASDKPTIFFPFLYKALGLVSDLRFFICTEVNEVSKETEQAEEAEEQTGKFATKIDI